MRTPRTPVRTAGLVALGALVLAGCSSPVTMDPAPQAADPRCADVLLRLPDQLGGAERRPVTAQGTRAWGSPPIQLWCGVEAPPAATTDRCIGVQDAGGESVDWVVREYDDVPLPGEDREDRGSFTFTTYGREPAVAVVVPVEYAGDDATSVLVSLAPAVSQVPAERACLSLDEVD